MEIHPAARKHRIAVADLEHAVGHNLYAGDIDVDDAGPLRVLYLGPDRAGNLLEVIVIERDDASELAIHAMKMKPKYRKLLRSHSADE